MKWIFAIWLMCSVCCSDSWRAVRCFCCQWWIPRWPSVTRHCTSMRPALRRTSPASRRPLSAAAARQTRSATRSLPTRDPVPSAWPSAAARRSISRCMASGGPLDRGRRPVVGSRRLRRPCDGSGSARLTCSLVRVSEVKGHRCVRPVSSEPATSICPVVAPSRFTSAHSSAVPPTRRRRSLGDSSSFSECKASVRCSTFHLFYHSPSSCITWPFGVVQGRGGGSRRPVVICLYVTVLCWTHYKLKTPSNESTLNNFIIIIITLLLSYLLFG